MDTMIAPLGGNTLAIFLCQLGIVLLAALVLGRIAVWAKLPSIVGEIGAGILLGPTVLQNLFPNGSVVFSPAASQLHLVDAVGQLGVLLLVGITGAQLDFQLLRSQARTSALVSIFGLIVPLGLGIAVGFLLPAGMFPSTTERPLFALFLGVALCVSAIPVIAKTLMDMGLFHRDIGQLTLTAAVIDDAVGWVLLSLVATMATVGLGVGAIATGVGTLVAVLVVAIIVVRPVVGILFKAAERADEPAVTIALATGLILLAAATTHALHMEAVFGGFVMGMLIGRRWLHIAALAPLRLIVVAVLAPIFFATVGLRVDLTLLVEPQVAAVGLLVLFVAMAGKLAGAYVGARLSKLGNWQALALGSAMNARGVIEIIIAMTGLRLGVLNVEMFTVIVMIAIVTSLAAPPMLRFAIRRVEITDAEVERELRSTGEPARRTEADAMLR